MKPAFQIRQPTQGEMQSVINALNQGHMQQTEQMARALLRQYPQHFMLHHVLGIALENQGKFTEAEASYRSAIAIDSKVAELHFNLGAVLGNLGQQEAAIASYRKAVALKPNLTVAYFNLGFALQALGRFEEAVPNYRRAISQQPGFYEAYANLGTILQAQGKIEEALICYRQALAIHPDALGHFNVGTALRDLGNLDEAINSYRSALALDASNPDIHNNLGETLRDMGNMDAAVQAYQAALAISPHHAAANYNMAEFLYLAKRYEEAIPYFERSQLGDWQERILYCLYKSENFDAFQARLPVTIGQGKHVSPFLATLSTHYATNFQTPDPYQFCPNPMDYVFHGHIDALSAPDSPLLAELLRDITSAAIAERKQGRLHYGIQSAGNLFKRSERSFKQLSELIREQVERYRAQFDGRDCELMRSFPSNIEFASSWYVKMQKGGHLTSHIHEIGWLSGSVYLALPQEKQGPHDGSIEFSTHGDDYPLKGGVFPTHAIAPRIGDIVLFPSSVFHRTIPFNSNEDRICVAFDVRP